MDLCNESGIGLRVRLPAELADAIADGPDPLDVHPVQLAVDGCQNLICSRETLVQCSISQLRMSISKKYI